jgi:hypothetical protein
MVEVVKTVPRTSIKVLNVFITLISLKIAYFPFYKCRWRKNGKCCKRR